MTFAQFRTWITNTFFSNSQGAISGDELQQALLECCNQIEAMTTWTPIFGLIDDAGGARKVLKVVDWINGTGTKPSINVYVGSSGYVVSAGSAVNLLGATGPTGAAGTASASSFLGVTVNNPTGGILSELINSAASAWNGVRLKFTKAGLASWFIGMPTGSTSAFIIEGFDGTATNPEYVRITATGDMGIGTSAPAAKLDVAGTVQAVTYLLTSVTSNRKLVLYDTTGNGHQFYGLGVNSGILRFQVLSTSDAFVFYAGTSSTTSFELFRIQGNGKVGIGVGSPTEYLDVVGRVKAMGYVTTGSAPTIAPGAGLGTTGGTASVAAGSNDAAGKITLGTTAGVAVNAVLATVTFNTAYSSAPRAIILSPRNAKATDEIARFYVSSISATQFTISSANSSPSQPYSFDLQYVVIA